MRTDSGSFLNLIEEALGGVCGGGVGRAAGPRAEPKPCGEGDSDCVLV